jgi:cell fate regulator YaaT (PSP1 superfamily)
MHLVEVAFKGNRKEFFAWEGTEPPPARASVVVEADRGEDLGVVYAVGEHAEKRCLGCTHGIGSTAPARKVLRVASTRDMRQARELRAQDEAARQKGMERVKAHGLVMKLSDAEWQWDRKKLTFYFTAERRVDFRNLVRDLAALFRARIELKQIGVRDEAKRLDGVGRCGRQFCSAGWLPELRPVNLGVAKDQHLSLNPSQISGACGRLMCCLRYEHEFYVQSRKRFPKEGKVLVASVGEEKVVSNDIFNERVTLRSTEGETRVVPLAQLRRELAATGHPMAADARDRDALGSGAAVDDFSRVSASDIDSATDGALALNGIDGELDRLDDIDRQTVERAELDDALEADLALDAEADDLTALEWPSTQAGPAPTTPLNDSPSQETPRPRARGQRSARRSESRAAQERQRPAAQGSDTDRPPDDAAGADAPGTEAPAADRVAGAGGPRRRRGRRGGRRGRGKGGPAAHGSQDTPEPTADPPQPGESRKPVPPPGHHDPGTGSSTSGGGDH